MTMYSNMRPIGKHNMLTFPGNMLLSASPCIYVHFLSNKRLASTHAKIIINTSKGGSYFLQGFPPFSVCTYLNIGNGIYLFSMNRIE